MTRILKSLPLCLLILSAGCGQGGPEGPVRYQLSGKILFDGVPLPSGTIVFDPDVSKGNSGPQGFAQIVNGHYDTSLRDGKGSTGGPMIISIQGQSSEVVTEGNGGRYLFQDYSLEQDLPKENFKLDIEVPKEASNPKTKQTKKAPVYSP